MADIDYLIDYLPRFFGAKKDIATIEAVALSKLKPQILDLEPHAERHRWWDYRGVGPAHLTYLFAHEYSKAWARALGRSRDSELENYVSAFAGADVFMHREFSSVWKARQHADALGMPYDVFCNAIMNEALRTGWKNLPRPAAMYCDRMISVAQVAFTTFLDARLPFFNSHWLKVGSPAPWKADFDEWVVTTAFTRPTGAGYLMNMVADGWIEQHTVDAIQERLRLEYAV